MLLHPGMSPLDEHPRPELWLRTAIGFDDDDVRHLLQLGVSSLEAKLVADAHAIFLVLSRLHPGSFVGPMYVALSAELLGEHALALASYRAAGALLEAQPARTPDEEALLRDLALLYALALLRSGDTVEAERLLARLAVDERASAARELLGAMMEDAA